MYTKHEKNSNLLIAHNLSSSDAPSEWIVCRLNREIHKRIEMSRFPYSASVRWTRNSNDDYNVRWKSWWIDSWWVYRFKEMQENKFKQAIRDSTDKTFKTSIDNNKIEISEGFFSGFTMNNLSELWRFAKLTCVMINYSIDVTHL